VFHYRTELRLDRLGVFTTRDSQQSVVFLHQISCPWLRDEVLVEQQYCCPVLIALLSDLSQFKLITARQGLNQRCLWLKNVFVGGVTIVGNANLTHTFTYVNGSRTRIAVVVVVLYKKKHKTSLIQYKLKLLLEKFVTIIGCCLVNVYVTI
jgi:hypothetical protein